MTQQLNQFKPSAQKGDVVYTPVPVQPAQVYSSESSALVPGQPVKLYSIQDKDIAIVTAAADTDVALFGVVAFDIRVPSFAAKKIVGLYRQGAIYWAEAGESINPGDKLMLYATGVQVKKATSGKVCFAIAVTGTATVGNLIQVQIIAPMAPSFAEVNAGGTSGWSGQSLIP